MSPKENSLRAILPMKSSQQSKHVVEIGGSSQYVISCAPGQFYVLTKEGKVCLFESDGYEKLSEIEVGRKPVYAVDGKNSYLYVLNKGSHSVSIIDTRNHVKLPDDISVGKEPAYAALSNNGRLYVMNYHNQVSIIDTTTNKKINDIFVGVKHSCNVFLSLKGDSVYLLDILNRRVHIFNTQTAELIKDIEVGYRPSYSVLNPVNQNLYVMNEESEYISVINTETNEKAGDDIKLERRPHHLVLGPHPNLYVFEGGSLSLIDMELNKVTKQILHYSFYQKNYPISGVLDSEVNGYLYVLTKNDVAIIDTKTNECIKKISLGDIWIHPKYIIPVKTATFVEVIAANPILSRFTDAVDKPWDSSLEDLNSARQELEKLIRKKTPQSEQDKLELGKIANNALSILKKITVQDNDNSLPMLEGYFEGVQVFLPEDVVGKEDLTDFIGFLTGRVKGIQSKTTSSFQNTYQEEEKAIDAEKFDLNLKTQAKYIVLNELKLFYKDQPDILNIIHRKNLKLLHFIYGVFRASDPMELFGLINSLKNSVTSKSETGLSLMVSILEAFKYGDYYL